MVNETIVGADEDDGEDERDMMICAIDFGLFGYCCVRSRSRLKLALRDQFRIPDQTSSIDATNTEQSSGQSQWVLISSWFAFRD
jgi:hypothetical protein